MKSRAHVYISGRVQGVFFRFKTREKAEENGIVGWIRNLKDGRVESIFEGDKEPVKKLVEFCYHGPMLAKVTHVKVNWEKYVGAFQNFKII